MLSLHFLLSVLSYSLKIRIHFHFFLHKLLTSNYRWSVIAAQMPGRTDNDIKNYWNTKLKKKLMGLINHNSQRKPQQAAHFSSLLHTTSLPSSPSFTCSNSTSYNYTLAGSFTEPISFSSSPLSNNSFSTASIQETFEGSMQNYQVKDSLIRFGGEAS